MNKWLLSAAGGASLASALLWQPPFYRELAVCGLIALMVAVGGFLKELGDRQ
jgi:hypothetical protein